MNIVICGGGLQGTELCFLAKQAHFVTYLIDKIDACPAANIADHMICFDLLQLENADNTIIQHFENADIIIPATENQHALKALCEFCEKHRYPLAFDMAAFTISSSKIASREIFMACNSPIPTPFTENYTLAFPLIAKPEYGSGSQGVQVFYTEQDFIQTFPLGCKTPNWLFEAYCHGPSYSIEVCGTPNHYTAYTITSLHMDSVFDCASVTVPSHLPAAHEALLEQEAIKLAHAINLHGLMDLEVILTDTGYKILEIDARFPSQTPTAVYYASGINLVEELIACFIPYTPKAQKHTLRPVKYGHVLCNEQGCHAQGEHIMQSHGPLMYHYFNESYPSLIGKTPYSMAATLIIVDEQQEGNIANSYNTCIQSLQAMYQQERYL